MNKFAKVFDLKNGAQLLVKQWYCSEDDDFKVSFETKTDDMLITASPSYTDEALSIEHFQSVGQDEAEEAYEGIILMLNNKS